MEETIQKIVPVFVSIAQNYITVKPFLQEDLFFRSERYTLPHTATGAIFSSEKEEPPSFQTFANKVDFSEPIGYTERVPHHGRRKEPHMIFGYARVSTTDQKLDRQIAALKEFVPEERNILTDTSSGKQFDRPGYHALVGTAHTTPLLRKGDTLVITSIDRLGRNYQEIQAQWYRLTKELQVQIKVLDMPLLDTTGKDNLESTLIADLVLQILSYVAEKERNSIRERQRQGIETAKAKGRHLGRPNTPFPKQWQNVYTEWKNGEITAVIAYKTLGLTKTTFYKLVKQYEGRAETEKA